MTFTKTAACVTALALAAPIWATPVWAAEWALDGAASKLSFGSVKKHYIGEVHSFTGLSGTVSADGAAAIEIDLSSVETLVDIRNERMIEHVFKFAPKAMLSAQLDMDGLTSLPVGETMTMEFDGALTLLGTEVDVPIEAFVARLGEDKVMVTTDMIYVGTDELEVDAGIDTLKNLAELSDITRAIPVTLRLVFTSNDQGA